MTEIRSTEKVVTLAEATVDESPNETAVAGSDMVLYEESVWVTVLKLFVPSGRVTGTRMLIGGFSKILGGAAVNSLEFSV